MRLLPICLLLSMLAMPMAASAQDVAAEPASTADDVAPDATLWAPRTGDAWVDTWLADLNLYAERYADAFVDELVRYRSAPRPLVEQMMADEAWRPADIYVACATAQAT